MVACFLSDSGAALLVTDHATAPALGPVTTRNGVRHETPGAPGGPPGSFDALTAGAPDRFDPVDRAPGDLASPLYTSGTTGRSKGAMLTHGNLLSNAQVLTEAWRFTPADVLLHALPVFHTHGPP